MLKIADYQELLTIYCLSFFETLVQSIAYIRLNQLNKQL